MNIKELAAEIRRYFAPAIEIDPIVYKPGGLLCQLLDMIDRGYTAEGTVEMPDDLRKGTVLYIPDKPQSLKEAAQAVLGIYENDIMHIQVMDNLKAALEREE